MKATLAVWSTFLLMAMGLSCLGAAKTVEATKAKVAIKEVATFIFEKGRRDERRKGCGGMEKTFEVCQDGLILNVLWKLGSREQKGTSSLRMDVHGCVGHRRLSIDAIG
jgi:hypothetical protein